MTKTQHTFDLSPPQSEQLAKTGSCVAIEPMNPQPEFDDPEFKIDDTCDYGIWDSKNRWQPFKYKPGDSVTIRQNWSKIHYNCMEYQYITDRNLHIEKRVDKIKDCFPWEFSGLVSSTREENPASTMPEHLYIQATIQTVDVIQVKNIEPINLDLGIMNFKDWFNQQFSTPRPVECKTCEGEGVVTASENETDHCYDCEDGIESYISCVYDEDITHFPVMDDFSIDDGQAFYKDKSLTIITNPYLHIIKIGAVEK